MSKTMEKARKVKEENRELVAKLVKDTGYSKRAIKSARKIGFSEAQIMAVQNETALWNLVTNVDPKLVANMPAAELKDVKPRTDFEPTSFKSQTASFDIEISPQVALTWKRGDHEQSALDHFINRNSVIKQNLVRVIITRRYVPNNTSKYETGFEIHYKEPK